jgi:hypothetical protein
MFAYLRNDDFSEFCGNFLNAFEHSLSDGDSRWWEKVKPNAKIRPIVLR